MLPRFLAAASGVWDELCVVDTGSTDATPKLLEEVGARVIHRPWDDDFAAARNAGLQIARGDWILYLDADEMPPPTLASQIRQVAQDPGAGAATVIMRNELPDGNRRDSRLLRMFHADPSVRFEFPIHEDPSRTVAAHLEATGRKMVHLSAVVEHLGYRRERAVSRNKKERDSRILRRCLAERPGDLYSWFKLLELARFWADGELLRQTALACRPVLEDAARRAPLQMHFAGDLVVLIGEGMHGRGPAALRFIEEWQGRIKPSPALLLRRGELRELSGDASGAAADFSHCLTLPGDTGDLQLATVRPLLGLARLALSQGDFSAARRRVDEALAHNPRDREGLLSALFIRLHTEGPGAVEDFTRTHIATHGESSELEEMLREILPRSPGAARP